MSGVDGIYHFWKEIGHFLVISLGIYPFLFQILCAKIKKHANKLRHSTEVRPFLGVRGKSQDIFIKPDTGIKALKMLVALVALGLFATALNNVFPSYFSSVFMQKSNLVSLIVSLTGISMTVSAILATFDKKYYLCFSIRDILSASRYNEHLFLVGLSCAIFSLVAFVTPEVLENGKWALLFKNVLYVAGMVNILSVAQTMRLVYKIVFSGKRTELKLLEQLHRLFDICNFDISNMKGKEYWNRMGTIVCVEYLADKYISCCNRLSVEKIMRVEYVTTSERYRKRWDRKARSNCVKACFIWITFSLFVVCVYTSYALKHLVFIGIIYVLFAVVNLTLDDEWIQRARIDLYLGEWGYYIVEKGGKEHCCSLGLFTLKDKYQKLFDRANDIVAIFYLQKELTVSRDVILEGFNALCQLMKMQEIDSTVYFLPVFSVGYFLYNRECRNDELLVLKEIYQELSIKGKGDIAFSKMMYGQIYGLIRYKINNTNEFNKLYAEYMHWLRSE